MKTEVYRYKEYTQYLDAISFFSGLGLLEDFFQNEDTSEYIVFVKEAK